jgi:hypothetical protein
MKLVILTFVRAATGSVVHIIEQKPNNTKPFAWVEGFNGFEIRSEIHASPIDKEHRDA